MAANDWQDVPLDDDWQEIPLEEEKSLLGRAADAVVGVGKALDSVTGAPTRAAIGRLQDGGGLGDAASAFGSQFGEDPELAPTGKQIAERAGLDGARSMSERFPSLYTDEPGLTIQAKKGGFLDFTPAGAAGLAIDVFADPTTVIPPSAIAKSVRSGTNAFANAAKRTGKALDNFSVTRAAKQAGPDSISDFRLLDRKNKLEEFGRFAMDEGVVTPLASFDDVAERATAIREKYGQVLGNFEKAIDGRFDDLAKSDLRSALFNPARAANRIETEVIGKLSPINDDLAAELKQVVEKMRGMGDRPMTFKEARELKNALDKRIPYSKGTELTPAQKITAEGRAVLNDEIEKAVEAVSARTTYPQAHQDFLEAKRRYGLSAEMENMANDRLLRFNANRWLSPSDYGIGAVTGAAAGVQSDDPVTGFLAGAAGAGANRFARKYGNSVAATIANRAAPVARGAAASARQTYRALPAADAAKRFYQTEMGIRRSSEAMDREPKSADKTIERLSSTAEGQRYAATLARAKERGEDSYATTLFTLQQTDPEFRRILNGE